MRGLREQFGLGFRLYFRNKMGMFYNYLFPAIFLLAFRVLYRNEPVPLARHMGQLLTVTILGGACLGFPTTLVSERERGVWRRYRLTPVSTHRLLGVALLVRFFIVVTAGLLQLVLSMAIGLPFPQHLRDLAVAYTFVTFAFLSLGLVVAAIADNVPSVQALGQCIFLPMLIIGGVAVPLSSLPDWALHVSAFFPGRYAVEVLQACFTRQLAEPAPFDFLALFLIGIAGFVAGSGMFRWDSQQKFSAGNRVWLVGVLVAWGAVGGIAEFRGGITGPHSPVSTPRPTIAAEPAPVLNPRPVSVAPDADASRRSTRWQDVTIAEINHNVDFRTLPSDGDIVAPIARAGLDPPPDLVEQIDGLKAALPEWQPGKVADPEQRVRNLMYVAAVPDVLRMEQFESYVPMIVFAQLRKSVPKDDLVRLLYWVAVHPSAGDASAVGQMQSLGIENPPSDLDTVRERVAIYSLKLVGRLIGKIGQGQAPGQITVR